MTDRSVGIGGGVANSAIVTGDGNLVSLSFGEALRLPLQRRQIRPPERRRRLGAGERRELDLLDPARSPVPLVGRDALLDELAGWLADEVDVSVHALVGQAGSGKTRLAMELCRRVDPGREVGDWAAGFLSASDLPAVAEATATRRFDWERPTLLVIDYAGQAHAALARWLDRLAGEKIEGTLRILLLEREAPEGFGWWRELTGSGLRGAADRADLFRDPSLRPQPLPGLEDVEHRRQAMAAALAAAAGAGGAAEPVPAAGTDPAFDAALGEPGFGNPLSLVMAGVLAAERGPRAALALRRLDMARRLARRELDRFEALAGADANAMRHLSAFNGLAGGLPIAGLTPALAAELRAAGIAGAADGVATLLQQELPEGGTVPAEGEAEGAADAPRLATVQPDLVGEGLILEALSGEPQAEAGAPALVLRAYAATGPHAARALMQLLQDHAFALEDATASEAQIAEARRLMAWLAELAGRIEDPETLAPLAEALPRDTLVLREPALEITRRLADAFRANHRQSGGEVDASRAAGWLNNLAVRLSALGRREDALAAAQEAADLYRALAEAGPDAFRPNLAGALNTLSGCLSDLGRPENALAAAEEAADLYRALAEARPDASRPDLAGTLANLGARLSDLGRREDALAAAEEAVAIRRALAEARPDAFRPDLAGALNNLANRFSELGRREDALAAAEKAADLFRALAEDRPDAFRPALATALNNLAGCLSDLGRNYDALAAVEEAVRIRRALADARPDAFQPDLAAALNNLAGFLSDLGRREDALAAAQEAADLYRALAEARPDAFRPNLAGALNTLSGCLSDLGRPEDALAAAEEAIDIRRDLFGSRPDAFAVELSVSLGVLTDIRRSAADGSGALDAIAEAICVLRPDFERAPQAVARWMGMHAQRYAALCDELGREPDAALIGPVIETFRRMQEAGGEDGERG